MIEADDALLNRIVRVQPGEPEMTQGVLPFEHDLNLQVLQRFIYNHE